MVIVKKTIIMLLAIFIISCGNIVNASSYYTVSMTSPSQSKSLQYSDDYIEIIFPIPIKEIKHIPFILYNKTFEPIKIDWNQVSIITPNNTSLKIYHSGLKYIDIHDGKAMDLGMIPPKTKLNDFVGLPNNLTYVGSYVGWIEKYMFPTWFNDSQPLVNNDFGLFLPLEVNGQTKYYTFMFSIDKVSKEWDRKAFLGIATVSKEFAELANLKAKWDSGLYITGISQNSPAQSAGLQVSDILLSMDNNDISSTDQFYSLLESHSPGDTSHLTIFRNGNVIQIDVVLSLSPEPK